MPASSVLRRAFSLSVMAFAAPAVLGSCGSDAPERLPEDAPSEEPVVDQSAPGVHRLGPDRYEVVIQAFEGGYRPSEIRLPVGSEVTFRVTSEDVEHGFTIEAAGVQLELSPNQAREVKHTFTETGEYPFQCHVYCGGGHESMRGKIIVESPATGAE